MANIRTRELELRGKIQQRRRDASAEFRAHYPAGEDRCACGFRYDVPVEIGQHLARAHADRIRELLRVHIADEMMSDLHDNESLTKEIQELCDNADDRAAFEEELLGIIAGVIEGGRDPGNRPGNDSVDPLKEKQHD